MVLLLVMIMGMQGTSAMNALLDVDPQVPKAIAQMIPEFASFEKSDYDYYWLKLKVDSGLLGVFTMGTWNPKTWRATHSLRRDGPPNIQVTYENDQWCIKEADIYKRDGTVTRGTVYCTNDSDGIQCSENHWVAPREGWRPTVTATGTAHDWRNVSIEYPLRFKHTFLTIKRGRKLTPMELGQTRRASGERVDTYVVFKPDYGGQMNGPLQASSERPTFGLWQHLGDVAITIRYDPAKVEWQLHHNGVIVYTLEGDEDNPNEGDVFPTGQRWDRVKELPEQLQLHWSFETVEIEWPAKNPELGKS